MCLIILAPSSSSLDQVAYDELSTVLLEVLELTLDEDEELLKLELVELVVDVVWLVDVAAGSAFFSLPEPATAKLAIKRSTSKQIPTITAIALSFFFSNL